MTPEEFAAAFDTFEHSALRLEVHQTYAVDAEDPFARAFVQGLPRPERSIRTSPWLARMATTTLAGKSWTRIRLIRQPLTEYVRHELLAYVESAVVGEQIYIAEWDPELVLLEQDFWLFDAGEVGEYAVVMRYDTQGIPTGYLRVTDTAWCKAQRDFALAKAVSLAEYLARGGQ